MNKKQRVMVFGTFDTVHKGHQSYIKQALAFGNELIVVVATDTNVQKFKSKSVHNERTRLKHVKKMFPFATCVLGDENDPYLVVRNFLPDTVCLGYDQRSFDDRLGELFPNIRIERLKPFEPDIYKTSKIFSPNA